MKFRAEKGFLHHDLYNNFYHSRTLAGAARLEDYFLAECEGCQKNLGLRASAKSGEFKSVEKAFALTSITQQLAVEFIRKSLKSLRAFKAGSEVNIAQLPSGKALPGARHQPPSAKYLLKSEIKKFEF